MMKNQISVEIPANVIGQINSKFNEIKALLDPYMGSLTPQERKKLPKMSDKTVAFVTKVVEYTSSNPEYIPNIMEADEFKKDFKANQALLPLNAVSQQLTEMMKGTIILTGHEAYVQALFYYGSVKLSAKSGDPEAKAIYEDLSKRFPRGKASEENKKDE